MSLQTWTPMDTLDDCDWTACLYPPDPPPESQLLSLWSGDPVEFGANVSYVCQTEQLFFEEDRELGEFNLTCQDGGGWEEPAIWPVCLPCENIFKHLKIRQ